MPTTPNRGWPYPSLEQNPYYDTIVSTFEAMDTDVHTLRSRLRYVSSITSDSSPITGTTIVAFDNSTVALPAGVLNTPGTVIRFTAGGRVTTTGAAGTMLLGIAFGSQYAAGTSTAVYVSPVTDLDWLMQGSAIIRASNTIVPQPSYIDMAETYLRGYGRQPSYTDALTSSLTSNVQVIWPVTGQAIILTQFVIEVLLPGP